MDFNKVEKSVQSAVKKMNDNNTKIYSCGCHSIYVCNCEFTV